MATLLVKKINNYMYQYLYNSHVETIYSVMILHVPT